MLIKQSYISDNDNLQRTEISVDFKVYPCCTLHAFHQLDKTFFDEYLDGLPEDWNSLKNHSLDEILKRFKDYIKPEKWKRFETTPDCCKRACLK